MLKPLPYFLVMLAASGLAAQFITPDYRVGSTDADFAYWVGFDAAYTLGSPPYGGLSFDEVNIPFAGGNATARLAQDAVPGAIVTTSGSIYSFDDEPTAFKVYDNPAYDPGGILFQTQSLTGSQSLPDLATVKLYYRSVEGGVWIEYDQPVTAAVQSSDALGNQFTAWEWDVESLVIADYYIQFAYELNHSAFVEAQLDTSEAFEAQIDGFGINIDTNIPFGLSFGVIDRSPEKLVYNDGEAVTLTATPNSSFVFVKWSGPFGESTENPLTITVTGDTDIELTLAPVSYAIWRQIAFASAHGGGTPTGDLWPEDLDYEKDGRVNALEYALGGDPEASDLVAKAARLELVEDGGHTYPALVYPEQIAATDLSYTVEVSADGRTWLSNPDPGGPYTGAPEPLALNDDGTRQVRVRSLTAFDAPAPLPFLRLTISLND